MRFLFLLEVFLDANAVNFSFLHVVFESDPILAFGSIGEGLAAGLQR